MGDYQAWAATGLVVGHESWSEADFGPGAEPDAVDASAVQIASRMVERQKFYLRQRDGRDIEVNLADCGLLLRDGHTATAIWVARKGAEHGFCLYVENHTTGAETRLPHNIKHIRSKITFGQTAKYGLIAAVPAALVMPLWLMIPGVLDEIDLNVFILGATAAVGVLFGLGLVVSKLVLDYFQADNDQQAWEAVTEVLARVRAPAHTQIRPRSRGA
jgi:hypothetical protein